MIGLSKCKDPLSSFVGQLYDKYFIKYALFGLWVGPVNSPSGSIMFGDFDYSITKKAVNNFTDDNGFYWFDSANLN